MSVCRLIVSVQIVSFYRNCSHNDVTLNTDKGKVTALTLLDLSAAFDTLDHNILIKCLSLWYGISGTALSWFSSYLGNTKP